ncbi:hypothetical protein B0H16DRAFT_562315 [Mycena metata]|uniref:C2H2-type domain-containing protein n=1 Tax=Mycena metata TaxID=1033252 RepID=A0AAD7MDW1_9AGAR|nr:hypothetical protein B0H16DRAFT_562315 [Mycena metata]
MMLYNIHAQSYSLPLTRMSRYPFTDSYGSGPMAEDLNIPVYIPVYISEASPPLRPDELPPPGSSADMFQRAASPAFHGSQQFTSVAGNLIQNLHPTTHPTPLRPLSSGIENPTSTSNALGTVCSDSANYCSHLLRQGRGFPLYVPGPQRYLPQEYKKNGVMIGDVGRITPEGVFDFFFNIYLAADHRVHANLANPGAKYVPEHFSPLEPYDPRDLVCLEFDAGNYVASPFVQAQESDALPAEFPGGEFLFGCKGPSGALLALPYGARLEKLENVEPVRQYAACNAKSWYKHINGKRGRGLTNGSLYLITGCEKSRSGGMASFQSVAPGAEFQISFRQIHNLDGDYKYHFTRSAPARTKYFDGSADPFNQTTFLHGFSISLGEGIWESLFGVKLREITDSEMEGSQSDWVPFGSQRSLFSWTFDFFSGGEAGGKKYTDPTGESVTLSELSPTSMVVHPGRLINNFLLRERPEATVVITHDDDWRDILRDDGTEAAIKGTTELLQHISEQSTIKEKDGVISLVSKPKEVNPPPALPWFPSGENLSPGASESFHLDPRSTPPSPVDDLANFEDLSMEEAGFTEQHSSDYDLSVNQSTHRAEASGSDSFLHTLGTADTASIRSASSLSSRYSPDDSFFTVGRSRSDSHLPASALRTADTVDLTAPLGLEAGAYDGSSLSASEREIHGQDRQDTPYRHSVATPATVRAAKFRRKKHAVFVCHLCGRDFTAKHNLQNHINSHNSVKKHRCEHCGQSFGTAHVLRRHMKTCKRTRQALAQSPQQGHQMEV